MRILFGALFGAVTVLAVAAAISEQRTQRERQRRSVSNDFSTSRIARFYIAHVN